MEILTFCKNQGADFGNLAFLIFFGLWEFYELEVVEIDDLETYGLKLDLLKMRANKVSIKVLKPNPKINMNFKFG